MRRLCLTHSTLPLIGSGADHITSKCTGLKTAPVERQWILYVPYHVWEYRDWQTRGYQRLGPPVQSIGFAMLVNADVESSVESSVPDGAWREPSPPPFLDPWNESD